MDLLKDLSWAFQELEDAIPGQIIIIRTLLNNNQMESTASRQLIAFLLILVIIVLTPKYMEWVAPAPKTEDSNQTTDYQEPEQLDYSKQPKLPSKNFLNHVYS